MRGKLTAQTHRGNSVGPRRKGPKRDQYDGTLANTLLKSSRTWPVPAAGCGPSRGQPYKVPAANEHATGTRRTAARNAIAVDRMKT